MQLSESRASAMLSTASQRAEVLLEIGYQIQPVDAPSGLFFVFRPITAKRKFDKGGNEILGYFVQLGTQRDPVRCDCECFRLAGNCKHHLRVRSEVKRALRLFGLVPDPALDAWISTRLQLSTQSAQPSAFRAESETSR
nr:hypothetical protein [Armatimonas sp.]